MSDRPQPLRIAITTGEPAGVGPELTARALADAATRWPDARFTVLGDAGLIAARGGGRPRLDAHDGGGGGAHVANAHVANAHVAVAHRALAAPAEAGKLNPANGRYVLDLLDAAIDGALAGEYDAIVTAPLQKSTINDAGVPLPATPNISPSARARRTS